MKINKTILLAAVTAAAAGAAYFLDYRAAATRAGAQPGLLAYDPDQISFIQILKGNEKIGLQKSEKGWDLLEPVQDRADNDAIEDMLQKMAAEKQVSVVKHSEKSLTPEELKEFGLEEPALVFNFKNNLGRTQKISVGSVKNFEGSSYLRIDSENSVRLAGAFWHAQAGNGMIFYREKKLYRSPLARVQRIRVKSLREDFELFLRDGQWQTAKNSMALDQNRVRDVLKKISETKIEEYLFEGEPSLRQLSEKGLASPAIRLELMTGDSAWAVNLNLKSEDKALYGLTEKPTFLVKVEVGAWEDFGNITLDALRDRSSALAFNLTEVQKFYFKQDGREGQFAMTQGAWQDTGGTGVSPEQIRKIVDRVHDLKISEFIDGQVQKDKFEGSNMLILKSGTDKLVLQLNWGPAFKMKQAGADRDYYYARTQLSDSIFALDKKSIDSLELPAPAAAGAQDGK